MRILIKYILVKLNKNQTHLQIKCRETDTMNTNIELTSAHCPIASRFAPNKKDVRSIFVRFVSYSSMCAEANLFDHPVQTRQQTVDTRDAYSIHQDSDFHCRCSSQVKTELSWQQNTIQV
jgi:hypothetical protein